MFKHVFLLIYRNFKRFKGSFFINLTGLSTGLACTMLIYLWVNDELTFDKFHAKDSRLYQVMEHQQVNGLIQTTHESSGMMAQTLLEEIPEIEHAAAVAPPSWFGKFTLSAGNNTVKATGQYVGKDYFRMFSFGLTEGDESRVLSDKNAIVFSRELARRLFNTTRNVVGRAVRFQHQKEFLVSGVFEGTPANSSLQFDFALSFEEFKDVSPWVLQWGNIGPNAFVTVKPGADLERLNAKLAGIHKKQHNDSYHTVFLAPYSDRYLYGKYENGVQAGGRIEYVKLFSVIALFVLLIGCINFTNLSTAKATRRMKEVGIKKTIGAGRGTLIAQYPGESTLMAFLSLLTATGLVALCLPEFNRITGKQLTLSLQPNLVVALLLITAFTGLLAGTYPALYLSGFNPIAVLKGRLNRSAGELWARRGLVIFIVSVLVIYQQVQYVQTKNPGFDKDQILYFDMEGAVKKNPDAFLSAVKTIPGVVNASSTEHDMVGHNFSTSQTDGHPGPGGESSQV